MIPSLQITFVWNEKLSIFEGIYENGAKFQFTLSELPQRGQFIQAMRYLKSGVDPQDSAAQADCELNAKRQARHEAILASKQVPIRQFDEKGKPKISLEDLDL